MPLKPKKRFTLKLLSGYIILGGLVVLAGFFIYSEFNTYLDSQHNTIGDDQLLQTNQLLTELYEAENLSKLALQDRKTSTFRSYAKKVDSIHMSIEYLKELADNNLQNQKLDSVQMLLQQKVYNNAELRRLKEKEGNYQPIDSLLMALNRLETDMGRITPEKLVPNFDELPLATQNSIKDYVEILNRNVPLGPSEATARTDVDSILNFSKSILNKAKLEHAKLERSLLGKEIQIYRNDLEVSRKLREIIASLEQDVLLETQAEISGRQRMLKRSTRLAWIGGLLGLFTIILFTFLTANDYWKGQLYRERLEKEKKFSESLLKSREQLISTVSHDLKSPLNIIKGYTELLQQDSENPKQLGYFKQLKSASDYVEHLINDLLDYSKLEAGKVQIVHEPFVPSMLLKELIQDFESLKSVKPISFFIDLEESTSKTTLGDSFRVRQILTNLIANALKFTKEGYIKIRGLTTAERGKHYLKIQVIDTGIGIEKDQLDSIFKEFVQTGDVETNNRRGYGLGLTISQKLAMLMGGALTAESELDKGSTFTLHLPWVPSQDKKEKRKLFASSKMDGKPCLTVIDDDVTLLALISEICKIHKIDCKTFSSFEDFRNAPELGYTHILTDIEMPVHDGFAIAKAFKNGLVEGYGNQPIIAMTGQRNMDSKRFEEVGFDAVLSKPFTNNQLLNVLSLFSIKHFPDMQAPEKKLANPNELFSASHVRSFVEDDKALLEVLSTFLQDTQKNIKYLKLASQKRDIQTIQGVAHKMLPMFQQLEVHSVVPQLQQLEMTTPKALSVNLVQAVTTLKSEFQPVKKQIEAYLITLSAGNA